MKSVVPDVMMMCARPAKDVLTTGEVARICKVAPRTVAKWFDRGELKGYRIPGSRDRRVPLRELVRFMKVHGIPLDSLDTGHHRVILVDEDPAWARSAGDRLVQRAEHYDVQLARNAFEAGLLAGLQTPHVIILDAAAPDFRPEGVIAVLRAHTDLRGTCLVATITTPSEALRQTLLQKGFHAVLAKPLHVDDLLDCLGNLPIV